MVVHWWGSWRPPFQIIPTVFLRYSFVVTVLLRKKNLFGCSCCQGKKIKIKWLATSKHIFVQQVEEIKKFPVKGFVLKCLVGFISSLKVGSANDNFAWIHITLSSVTLARTWLHVAAASLSFSHLATRSSSVFVIWPVTACACITRVGSFSAPKK